MLHIKYENVQKRCEQLQEKLAKKRHTKKNIEQMYHDADYIYSMLRMAMIFSKQEEKLK